jgi:hypothetical protein
MSKLPEEIIVWPGEAERHHECMANTYKLTEAELVGEEALYVPKALLKAKDEEIAKAIELLKNHKPTMDAAEAKIEALEKELAKRTWQLKQFKFSGTDGCETCETGRVDFYIANTRCHSCDPDGYKTYEERLSQQSPETPND